MEEFKRASLSDQIFDYIKRQIDNGTWKPGEKIPSETELARELGVSRMTLTSCPGTQTTLTTFSPSCS